MPIKFEWDTAKALLNFRSHGVTFDEATEVFNDPNAIEILMPPIQTMNSVFSLSVSQVVA